MIQFIKIFRTPYILISTCIFILFSCTILYVYVQENADKAFAQTTSKIENSSIYVSGNAIAFSKPDEVIVSLGIETSNKTATDALKSNSILMNNVLNSLYNNGVMKNETSTSSFSLIPEYNYSETGTERLIGFSVSNILTIKSYNLSNISNWIDVAVSNGVNRINNIVFTISEEKFADIKKNLIAQAINDAKIKAEIAASALGLNITGVKKIDILETGASPLPEFPYMYEKNRLAQSDLGSAPPILVGEQQISASVDIIFLMEKQQ